MKQRHGYWLPDWDEHFQTMMPTGAYQPEIRDHAIAEMRRLGFQFRNAVDIGANVGLWAAPLAEHFACVTCFEPVPENVECLRRNLEGRRSVIHQLALADAPGTTEMHMQHHSVNCGAPSLRTGPGDTYAISIELRTLDSFNLTDVDLIKIDVQGWESRVLKGAVDTLERCRPALLYENWPISKDLEAQINALGYMNIAQTEKDFLAVKVRR